MAKPRYFIDFAPARGVDVSKVNVVVDASIAGEDEHYASRSSV